MQFVGCCKFSIKYDLLKTELLIAQIDKKIEYSYDNRLPEYGLAGHEKKEMKFFSEIKGVCP